jgi:hypothetical protein
MEMTENKEQKPDTEAKYYTEENPGGPYSRGLKAMAEKERQRQKEEIQRRIRNLLSRVT